MAKAEIEVRVMDLPEAREVVAEVGRLRREVSSLEFTLHELVVCAHRVVAAQYPGDDDKPEDLGACVSILSGHLMDMGDLGDPDRYPRLIDEALKRSEQL